MIGFFSKYYVFAAAVQAGLIPLVIVGVLASAASVYYYLRVMVYLYFKEAHKEYTLFTPGALFKITIVLLAILTVYYGVEPILPFNGLMELITSRSEERRVGKECRCEWWPDESKEERE